MPDWTALRIRAFQFHRRLRPSRADIEPALIPAEVLLAAAEQETGVSRLAVPDSDALLSGAHAVLDRDMETIWYAAGLPATHTRLAQAHEFGHYCLHADVRHDAFTGEEDPEEGDSDSELHLASNAVGYSPEERREREANTFAAEFLLPCPLLRKAFVEEGWTASQIAKYVGVPETCVLSQLMLCLASSSSTDHMMEGTANDGLPQDQGTQKQPISLDQSQRAAAEIASGPVLVDAGPGTGKTRTLIARILFLLEHGVLPENILALTFSNKAAEEMRTRLRAEVDDVADRVWVGTFHAFGFEILRKYGDFDRPPRLLDTVEAVSLLSRHLDLLKLREFEYLHLPSLAFPDILRCISRAKDELETPENYHVAAERQQQMATDERSVLIGARSLEVAHVYSVYQDLLERFGYLDFGDLLMRAVGLLDSRPDVLRILQSQFTQILADEYQDINRASAQLLRRLAGVGSGFWAVGDLRQAIYRFRGASPANVREFDRDFPGGKRLRLDRNYRSLPSLVRLFGFAASGMATPADTRSGKESDVSWDASRAETPTVPITYAVAENEQAQADGLARQIRAHVRSGISANDQVILCRTNAQATRLAELLTVRGIPTQHLGNLLERDEVKDMLALVSLACERTGSGLARVAQFPEYQIPEKDVLLLLSATEHQERRFPFATISEPRLSALSPQGRIALQKLRSHLEPLLYRGDAWLLMARYLTERSDYLRALLRDDTPMNQKKRAAICQFVLFAQSVSYRVTGTVEERRIGFLDHLRLLLSCGEARSVRANSDLTETAGIRLMTVHSAKGLEFPVVYLPNLTRDQFPPRKMSAMVAPPPSFADDADEEGEDFLFFVALTRARDHLILSRPAIWRGKPVHSSPLLERLLPALQRCSAQFETWAPDPVAVPTAQPEGVLLHEISPAYPTETPAADNPTNDGAVRPLVTLSALQQYQDCPRRYYYQRVVRLPLYEGNGAYLAFHHCLEGTLRWVQEERNHGRAPSLADARFKMDSLWEGRGSTSTDAYSRVLRERAEQILASGYALVQDAPIRSTEMELVADLPNGRVSLVCDRVEDLPGGPLRIVRQVKSRARPEDHTEPRLALMRFALRQREPKRPIEIQLQYLRDGECKDVREAPRFEPARVAKFDSALQGIRNQHYPAMPDDKRCSQCPFLFICPA